MGTFGMIQSLLPSLKRASSEDHPSRVIIVSSGGAYTQKLDAADLQQELQNPFVAMRIYAQAKR
jgi:hypothetical protein